MPLLLLPGGLHQLGAVLQPHRVPALQGPGPAGAAPGASGAELRVRLALPHGFRPLASLVKIQRSRKSFDIILLFYVHTIGMNTLVLPNATLARLGIPKQFLNHY